MDGHEWRIEERSWGIWLSCPTRARSMGERPNRGSSGTGSNETGLGVRRRTVRNDSSGPKRAITIRDIEGYGISSPPARSAALRTFAGLVAAQFNVHVVPGGVDKPDEFRLGHSGIRKCSPGSFPV